MVAAVILTACGSSPSTVTASPSTSLSKGEVTTTTGVAQSHDVLHKVGEPFVLGRVQVTVLSVKDPFPSTPQTEPAAGNRLVSIEYEVVSRSPASVALSDLPAVELRDLTGRGYKSEHGRVSVSNGSGTPGQLAPGKSMESALLFEIPAAATGLRVAYRSHTSSGAESAVVTLD